MRLPRDWMGSRPPSPWVPPSSWLSDRLHVGGRRQKPVCWGHRSPESRVNQYGQGGCGCRLWGVWVVRTEMQPVEEKGEIVLTCSWAADGRPCSHPNTFPLGLGPPFWKCLALSPQGSPTTLRVGTLDGNSRPFPLAASSPALGVGQSSLSSRSSRTLTSEGCLSSQLACSRAPSSQALAPPPSRPPTAPHLPCPARPVPGGKSRRGLAKV